MENTKNRCRGAHWLLYLLALRQSLSLHKVIQTGPSSLQLLPPVWQANCVPPQPPAPQTHAPGCVCLTDGRQASLEIVPQFLILLNKSTLGDHGGISPPMARGVICVSEETPGPDLSFHPASPYSGAPLGGSPARPGGQGTGRAHESRLPLRPGG